MSFFVSSAVAQTTATQAKPGGFDPIMIIMMVGMFAFMYFFIIRPQRKRQKEHQNLVSALSKGDEVVLTSGM
ncbi:MAG: preprotein translocase subunit YajC, partial [Flavobacterium sp.]